MNDKQKASLEALLDIECKVAIKNDEKECEEGPWCEARRNLLNAFGISRSEEPETEEVEEIEEEQEED